MSCAEAYFQYLLTILGLQQIQPGLAHRSFTSIRKSVVKNVLDGLAAFAAVAETLARGDTKMSVRLDSRLQVDLRVVPRESFGAALQYFTGNKDHNIALRKIAQSKDWKLSEYGIFSGEKQVAGETEEEVYKKLGLAWIPPELRENKGEIEAAQKKKLPDLIG